MLGLLSKPCAAADLFACELHGQAGVSPTAPPVAALQPANPGQTVDSNSPHLQAAHFLRAPETEGAEAVKTDSLPPDAGMQSALVQIRSGTSRRVDPVAASHATAKEVATPKYEDGVWQSSAEAADDTQGVSKAAPGSGIGPVLAQIPGSKHQQRSIHGLLDTERRVAVPLALQSSTAGGGSSAQLESQEPADGPSQGQVRPVKGQPDPGKRQPISADIPASTTTEQAPTQQHHACYATSMAGAQQQPQVPSQTTGKTGQQATAASIQFVVAGTGIGPGTAAAGAGVGAGTGVGPGTAADTGVGMHADARAGSMTGKGGKHKGAGRGGSKGHEVGMCLTGSAAQALAVLQAGASSRPARAGENAGAHMPLLHQKGNNKNKWLDMKLMANLSFP